MVKIGKYIPGTRYQEGFCVYRKSYLLCMVSRNSSSWSKKVDVRGATRLANKCQELHAPLKQPGCSTKEKAQHGTAAPHGDALLCTTLHCCGR